MVGCLKLGIFFLVFKICNK